MIASMSAGSLYRARWYSRHFSGSPPRSTRSQFTSMGIAAAAARVTRARRRVEGRHARTSRRSRDRFENAFRDARVRANRTFARPQAAKASFKASSMGVKGLQTALRGRSAGRSISLRDEAARRAAAGNGDRLAVVVDGAAAALLPGWPGARPRRALAAARLRGSPFACMIAQHAAPVCAGVAGPPLCRLPLARAVGETTLAACPNFPSYLRRAALGFLYAVVPRAVEPADDVPIPELFGGCYGALDAAVRDAVATLRAAGVEPTFVFDGARRPVRARDTFDLI